MTISVIVAFCLVLVTSTIHYKTLRWLSSRASRVVKVPERQILLSVFVLFLAHLFQVALYAIAYRVLEIQIVVGAFGGRRMTTMLDYFYYSFVCFTSLGIGDIFPIGHLRFMTGMEALNGLLLIAWSGSFLFISMQRLWPWNDCLNCRGPIRGIKEQQDKK